MAFMTLDELDVGVVTTFQPSDADLVGFYLYNKLFPDPTSSNHKQAFPEICIYGRTGLPPWELWSLYQHVKFPNQEFTYFFTHAQKVNPNKRRKSRTIGSDGGTWSETGVPKQMSVCGIDATLRKFRFETNKNTEFEHHGAWLMDEYTIDKEPDFALCRIKVNDRGGADKKKKKKKRKFVAIENGHENMKSKQSSKTRKLEPRRSSSQQVCASSTTSATSNQVVSTPSPYYEDDQVIQVVSESNCSSYDETLIATNDHDNLNFCPIALFNEDNVKMNGAQFMASGVQATNSEQQEKQQDQASNSYPIEHRQQLLLDQDDIDLMMANAFDIPEGFDAYLKSLDFSGTNDEDQLCSLPG